MPSFRLAAIALAAALPAQEPVFRVCVGDPLPLLQSALRSDAVGRLFRTPGLGQLPPELSPPALLAGLGMFADWIPVRSEIVVPADGGPGLVALAEAGILLMAYEAALEVSDRQEREALRLMDDAFVASLRELGDTAVTIHLEWRNDAQARVVFDAAAERLHAMLEAEFEHGIEFLQIEDRADLLSVVMDLTRFTDPGELAPVLEELGVADPGGTRGMAARVHASFEGLILELAIERNGDRTTFSLHPREAPPRDPSPVERSFVTWEWSIGPTLERLRATTTRLEQLRTTPVGARTPDLEDTLIGIHNTARLLEGAATRGEGWLDFDEDGFEAESLEVPSVDGRTLGETGLLTHVPLEVELWSARADSVLPGTAERAVRNVADRIWADLPFPSERTDDEPAGVQERFELLEEILDLADRLGSYVDAFEPGWVIVLSSEGALHTESGSYRPAPAVAIIARPKSVNSGLAFARDLMTPIAEAIGGQLEFGDESISCRTGDGDTFGTDSSLRAFLVDGDLVICTSGRLAKRIRETEADRNDPEGLVATTRTSGARLAHLGRMLITSAPLLARRLGATDSDSIDEFFAVATECAALLGSVEVRETREGDRIRRRASIRFREAERESDAEILRRAAEAAGTPSLAADQMLVARGTGEYLGRECTFEFVYAADGRFRETVTAELPLDIAWDGQRYTENFGCGSSETVLSAFARGWAAAAAGLWSLPDDASLRVVDRAPDGISLAVGFEPDPREPRIILDPRTLLPRRFDQNAAKPLQFVDTTRFSDFEPIHGVRLPRTITLDNDTVYRIDEWSVRALDAERFSKAHDPNARFVEGAAPMLLHSENGILWVEGAIGDEEGWFTITPLGTGNFVDVSVAGATSEDTEHRAVLLSDVRFGSITASELAFVRTTLQQDGERRQLGILGFDVLDGSCARFDYGDHSLEILPPGSLDGDGFLPMESLGGHLILACDLPGGRRTWFAPMEAPPSGVWLKPHTFELFRAASWEGEGPLFPESDPHRLPWLDAAGLRIEPERTFPLQGVLPFSLDPTPLAVSNPAIGPVVLELDFPNSRYRFVP